jgi:hypothetical protein
MLSTQQFLPILLLFVLSIATCFGHMTITRQYKYNSHDNYSTYNVDGICSDPVVSGVLVLTDRCKLINFVFQIFPLFIPEISAGFVSYIVQIIPIYCARML